MKLEIQSISKFFGTRQILDNINLELSDKGSAAITGPNGAGKSTLIRILCGLIRPTSGRIRLTDDNDPVKKDNYFKYISLVAPYLELYDQLSAMENILFFAGLLRAQNVKNKIRRLFDRLHLSGYENEQVKTYSSGMKQRLKYIFALLSEPDILLIDEPTSNLDDKGIHIIHTIMKDQKKQGILIFATNDKRDLEFGDQRIELTV
jgi:heme exporter protein A